MQPLSPAVFLKSPGFALAVLCAVAVLAAVIDGARAGLVAISVVAAVRLAWLAPLLAKHKSVLTWLVGRDPPKSQMQILGELMAEGFARNPPPPYLEALRVVVKECADPSLVSIDFVNTGTNELRGLSIRVTDLLYPGVQSWDQWNYGGGSPTNVVADFWQPIEIASLVPAGSVSVQRKLFPGVLPVSISERVTLAGGVKAGGADYLVHVAVSSAIAPYRPPQRSV